MLPFVRPLVPPLGEWRGFLEASYAERRFTNGGPCVRRLESELSERVGLGRREAVLVASGTAGLVATLLALRAGDRVAVPSFTFPATAHAVRAVGGQPSFVDVHPETWELDPEGLRERLQIDPGIRAVIHVRAFGFCRDLRPIEAVCREFGVPLVVDSAAALGGRVRPDLWAGGQGDAEVFSLHATKVFGVGEGGVVVAPSGLAEAVRCAANFGLQREDVVQPGTNAKLGELPAAVGLAVLPRLDAMIRRRAEVASRYRRELSGLAACRLAVDPGLPPWQTFPVLLGSGGDAAAAVAAFRERGVEVRRYYTPALHQTTLFGGPGPPLPRSERLAAGMVCLPVYSDMEDSEQDVVLEAAREVLGG